MTQQHVGLSHIRGNKLHTSLCFTATQGSPSTLSQHDAKQRLTCCVTCKLKRQLAHDVNVYVHASPRPEAIVLTFSYDACADSIELRPSRYDSGLQMHQAAGTSKCEGLGWW